jgi:hypothetical protein
MIYILASGTQSDPNDRFTLVTYAIEERESLGLSVEGFHFLVDHMEMNHYA